MEQDPREGSGVIPLDWEAFLQPKGEPSKAFAGVNAPDLRHAKALAGVLRRTYNYDRLWMVFPNGGDAPCRQPGLQAIELVVRVQDVEGRVQWPISGVTDQQQPSAR